MAKQRKVMQNAEDWCKREKEEEKENSKENQEEKSREHWHSSQLSTQG
jgi:hypothetical protein